MEKVWGKLGEGLADKLFLTTYGQALAFFAGGLLAIKGADFRFDIEDIIKSPSNIAFAILFFLLVGVFAEMGATYQFWTIRIAEGYLPIRFKRLEACLSNWWKGEIEKKRDKLNEMSRGGAGFEKSIALLDVELLNLPLPQEAMPTKLGNILYAAEDYSWSRYGLDAVCCWPRLYPLLSDTLRTNLDASRNQLNEAARLLFWSVLFVVFWLPVSIYFEHWWFAYGTLVAVLVAYISYHRMVANAYIYGDLIRAAFDLHRFDLYAKLKYVEPKTFENERATGEKLSKYLLRGL
jgi:hypothetical protein